MTLPASVLTVWAEVLSWPQIVQSGATRFRLVDWRCELNLDTLSECDWPDAGFTEAKLSYLSRRYPPTSLPSDGCIASLDGGRVLYRRVDATRGWLADCLYLRHLGWSGRVSFECPGDASTCHAVLASAVAVAVVAGGQWRGASAVMARTLRRAVVHRAERRHERRAATRRVNDWAHRVADAGHFAETIERLDAQARVT